MVVHLPADDADCGELHSTGCVVFGGCVERRLRKSGCLRSLSCQKLSRGTHPATHGVSSPRPTAPNPITKPVPPRTCAAVPSPKIALSRARARTCARGSIAAATAAPQSHRGGAAAGPSAWRRLWVAARCRMTHLEGLLFGGEVGGRWRGTPNLLVIRECSRPTWWHRGCRRLRKPRRARPARPRAGRCRQTTLFVWTRF